MDENDRIVAEAHASLAADNELFAGNPSDKFSDKETQEKIAMEQQR